MTAQLESEGLTCNSGTDGCVCEHLQEPTRFVVAEQPAGCCWQVPRCAVSLCVQVAAREVAMQTCLALAPTLLLLLQQALRLCCAAGAAQPALRQQAAQRALTKHAA